MLTFNKPGFYSLILSIAQITLRNHPDHFYTTVHSSFRFNCIRGNGFNQKTNVHDLIYVIVL